MELDLHPVLSVAVSGGTAALLAYVALLTRRRVVSPGARLANAAFALWWWCAAAVMGLLGLGTLLGVAGFLGDALHTWLLHLRALPMSLGLCALLYYLGFLLTGRRRLYVPLAAFYAAHLAFTTYFFQALAPWETVVSEWDVRALPVAPYEGPLVALFGALLGLPALLAVFAFAAVGLRARDSAQRYRVALVGGGLGTFFLVIFVGFVLGWPEHAWFPVLYQSIALVGAAAGVLAYRPPAWVARRLGDAATGS